MKNSKGEKIVRPRHLQFEPMEGKALMVEVFGIGTVEIDVSDCGGSPCLDVYVHPAGDIGAPVACMRTYAWDQNTEDYKKPGQEH